MSYAPFLIAGVIIGIITFGSKWLLSYLLDQLAISVLKSNVDILSEVFGYLSKTFLNQMILIAEILIAVAFLAWIIGFIMAKSEQKQNQLPKKDTQPAKPVMAVK